MSALATPEMSPSTRLFGSRTISTGSGSAVPVIITPELYDVGADTGVRSCARPARRRRGPCLAQGSGGPEGRGDVNSLLGANLVGARQEGIHTMFRGYVLVMGRPREIVLRRGPTSVAAEQVDWLLRDDAGVAEQSLGATTTRQREGRPTARPL